MGFVISYHVDGPDSAPARDPQQNLKWRFARKLIGINAI
jgi:hypothetical protein